MNLRTLRPEAPAHGGSVVAREEGEVVLVSYALPGELVEAAPAGRRKGVSFARTQRVLEQAPERVHPPCPYFGSCGGCQWQHAEYGYQLVLKRRVVEDAWARAGLRLPADTPVLGMEEPWHYRIRGEFEAVYRADGFSFGFHRQRSHSLLAIDDCRIHDQRLVRALAAFRDTIIEMDVDGIQNLLLTVEPTGPGLLWALRFKGGRGVLPESFGLRVARKLPELVLLDDSMELAFWDLSFRVRSDTFVQTNYRQMLVLYESALGMLDARPGERILDLFSGVGTISIALARQAGSVTAIEENPASVALARLNARINGATNLNLLTGRVEAALRQVRLDSHQAAILDPPRSGCERAALAELLRLGLDRLVYISCDPITQARDLAALVMGGYRIRRAALVDMFPHTYHVESVALLERGA